MYPGIFTPPLARPMRDDLAGLRAEMRRIAQFALDASNRPDAVKATAALYEVAVRIERALGDKKR